MSQTKIMCSKGMKNIAKINMATRLLNNAKTGLKLN